MTYRYRTNANITIPWGNHLFAWPAMVRPKRRTAFRFARRKMNGDKARFPKKAYNARIVTCRPLRGWHLRSASRGGRFIHTGFTEAVPRISCEIVRKSILNPRREMVISWYG